MHFHHAGMQPKFPMRVCKDLTYIAFIKDSDSLDGDLYIKTILQELLSWFGF